MILYILMTERNEEKEIEKNNSKNNIIFVFHRRL